MNSKPKKILEQLKKEYPTVDTPLIHRSAFELLVATILSAQTLDSTVNKVTPNLFSKYPNPTSLSNSVVKQVESIIKPVNYYKTKAENIIKMARILVEQYDSKVPSSISSLINLPGVGRKTANVVLSEWFVKKGLSEPQGIVVDTHVARTARRLGLTKNKDPKKIEQDLMKIFPKKEWGDVSLRFIFHGRFRCKARKPLCSDDPFWSKICNCVNEIQ
jgi:endonuclease-3